jgi:D-arabinose 5-phosphate isomerase GutQ
VVSPLAQIAHVRVLLPAVFPGSASPEAGAAGVIQPMRALFEQAMFIYLDCVVLQLMARLGVGAAEMERRHANLE